MGLPPLVLNLARKTQTRIRLLSRAQGSLDYNKGGLKLVRHERTPSWQNQYSAC